MNNKEIIKCLIVDDDEVAIKLLSNYCNKVDELKLLGTCSNVTEGLAALKEFDIDLIFLDIEMPGGSGFELLDKAAALPMVIFTTSKTEYAYKAYQLKAIDYLKKPFNYPRFVEAVQLAKIAHENNFNLLNQGGDPDKIENIFIKDKGKLIRIPIDNILYFKNESDYVRIITSEGNHLIYSTLKKVVDKVPPSKFMRVHRSYIVNIKKIVNIEDNTLVIARKVIPIGKAHRSKLLSKLNFI